MSKRNHLKMQLHDLAQRDGHLAQLTHELLMAEAQLGQPQSFPNFTEAYSRAREAYEAYHLSEQPITDQEITDWLAYMGPFMHTLAKRHRLVPPRSARVLSQAIQEFLKNGDKLDTHVPTPGETDRRELRRRRRELDAHHLARPDAKPRLPYQRPQTQSLATQACAWLRSSPDGSRPDGDPAYA